MEDPLGGFLQVICDVFNRRAIPLLWRLNAFEPALQPTLCHGDVESVDMKDLAPFLREYNRVKGFDMADVENYIRGLVGWPERQPAAHEPEDTPA